VPDAERNRRRLLDVALAELTATEGAAALETIARKAGVGIGTLYRHFPSREALVEAVYRSELERLCQEGAALLASCRRTPRCAPGWAATRTSSPRSGAWPRRCGP
jgi:AcrR family transcriptional regulator